MPPLPPRRCLKVCSLGAVFDFATATLLGIEDGWIGNVDVAVEAVEAVG